ncbi:cation:proton antiporter domain-containing protein [Acidiluteibacter ferrifornacis]|uniref:Sodium:proton exchanger n=1 Tax=Acidiluteibacter ferrifornacis TaxID=2692424 RepID=A0A6N9NIM4_9FLAO|nr:cation:proton antiporter [Acidiluteibacter ferrifornacis]NBG65047.1 sodium:proton exchanger [Acidiluteibacter ferrifornacis]
MQIIGPYTAIIGISLVIILSYFFNIISQKTNIPSVLLLIVLGILTKQGMNVIDLKVPEGQLFNILELLGIVGLIMIVLEAALDLELTKEKWPTIWKSFSVALISLLGSTFVLAYIINFFLIKDVFTCILYAVPLSVMSSAIIIPSVGGLSSEKKEFMVYEGTFSDILGIMLFYFLTGNAETESTQLIVFDVISNIAITVGLSLVISYLLVLIFQKLNSQVKLFLLIAVLLMLYSVGKLFHLSSLIIILVFGLVLNNYKIFFRGFMKKWINKSSLKKVSHEFHLVTIESAFVVRTFFFVLFGITITLQSLFNVKVAIISGLILLGLYIIRFIVLKVFVQKDILPQLFLAPRGLITILLFFAIPDEYQVENFDSGILLYTIIISCIIMAVSLVASGKKVEPVEDMSFIYGPKSMNEVETMPIVEQNSEDKDDLISEK